MKSVGKNVEKREPSCTVHCWWKCKLVQPLQNKVEVPPKIRNRTTIWSSNSTSGYYLKKMTEPPWKDVCAPTFTAVLFVIAKIWKQHKGPSIYEWRKMCAIFHIMGYFFQPQKIGMDLEGNILSETSQRKTNTKWSHLGI